MLFFSRRFPYRWCVTNRVIFCLLAGSLLFGISTAAHPQPSASTPSPGATETAKSFDPAAAPPAWLATARAAHMVDMGNSRDDHLFGRARLYRAGLYRAALQHVQADHQPGNSRSNPGDGAGK